MNRLLSLASTLGTVLCGITAFCCVMQAEQFVLPWRAGAAFWVAAITTRLVIELLIDIIEDKPFPGAGTTKEQR